MVDDFQEHKKTPEYQAAVASSQKRADDHIRLSKMIWQKSELLAKAEKLSNQAKKGNFFHLRQWEQQMVEDYDSGRLERSLQKLLSERAPIYRGIGASVDNS